MVLLVELTVFIHSVGGDDWCERAGGRKGTMVMGRRCSDGHYQQATGLPDGEIDCSNMSVLPVQFYRWARSMT